MNPMSAFNTDHYTQISEARLKFLQKWLPKLVTTQGLKNALDVGCGAGFFSRYLADLGLKVVALDARSENVTQAKSRHPDIDFIIENIENPLVGRLGCFDLTFSFGLLYHLENPFLAIRNLHGLTRKVLLIESMITPGNIPSATFVDEGISQDQSVNYIALVPSEAGFIKMLYSSGFKHVYITKMLPNHGDFMEDIKSRRKRTIIVAAKMELNLGFLRRIDPLGTISPWIKPLGYKMNRLRLFLQKPLRQKLFSAKYHLKALCSR
jgi:SAM-dependent methyltransferase